MHPEDIPRRRCPRALQYLVDEWVLSPMRLERLFDRIPLAERAIPMLGSAEGFDSTHWPLERDAALAELAALRLPESAFTDHPSLALDLSAARRVAVEGLLAEDVHRDLHPTARGVGRLLLEAIQRDVLDPEELLAEAVALAALSPSGFPPNEVHAETRGGPQSPVGNEAHRVSPDVAIIIAGTGDDVSRCGIHEEIERAISFLRLGAVEVLEAAFAGCRQLLSPTGEIAVLWVGPSGAYLATSGPRCQLLRARRGELEWLHRRRERAQSAGSFEVHTIDAREGDTFLLLDDEAWAEAVTKASARGPVRGPSGTSPRDQMRQNFAAWLTGSTPVDLTPRALSLAKLGDLANLLFAELDAPREAAAAIMRVPPWRPPADLAARIGRELHAFAEAEGAALELQSAIIQFRGDGHPPPGRVRHLVMRIGCDARLQPEEAERLAARFGAAFRQRHPWLCISQITELTPLERADDPSLQGRLDAVRALVDEVLRGRRGLEARVRSVPSFGRGARIEVLILRDDVDEADDEAEAAAILRKRLLDVSRALAETVDVDSDYIK